MESNNDSKYESIESKSNRKKSKSKVLPTKRELTAGHIIQDKCRPFVKLIDPQFKGDYCDHCMKRSKDLKKCSKCHQMYYCDKKCQQNDWIYHKNECKVYRKTWFEIDKCLVTERLLIRLFLTIKNDKSFATQRYRLFDGSDISIDEIEVKMDELSKDMNRMIEFIEICLHFSKYEIVFDRKQLLRYYGLVVFSRLRHSLLFLSYDLTRDPVAIGVYAETSILQHSCTPNAAVVNNGFTLEIRAMKSIGIGEEITISYIDLAKDRTERQSMLRNWFYFDCKCDKCEKNLDSDVNYPKFLEDLHQIYSFSNFGEIFGETYLKTINRKEAYNLFNRMNACYPRIYGQYSPVLTTYLMQQLLGMWRLSRGKRTNQPLVRELFNICDTNIKVTHGVDHYYYRLFKEYRFL